MKKKLVQILFYFMPLSAFAVDYYNPGAGNGVIFSSIDTSSDSIVIQSGNELVVTPMGIVTDFLDVGNDYGGSLAGHIYIESATDSVFTINSYDNISVGTATTIAAGKTLNIQSNAALTDLDFGDIQNDGNLNLYSGMFNLLNNGTVYNNGSMVLNAETINSGAITNNGTLTATTPGIFTLAQLSNYDTATINADILNSGDIQNESGDVTINLTTDLNSTGSIENSGTSMGVTADNINIDGHLKNDNASGVLNITANSLTVSGVTPGSGTSNVSFVNAGNFNATITGEAYFEYGLDISNMLSSNTFLLEANILTFGSGTASDVITQFYSNKLDSFTLNLTTQDLNTGAIINGIGNNNANMYLNADGMNLASVENDGDVLELNSDSLNINVTGNIINRQNATTNITSVFDLDAANLSNEINGSVNINTVNVYLDSITNTGDLLINAINDIDITSSVTNLSGTSSFNSSNINIGGTLSADSGITNINSSGNVIIADVSVNGGILNIDNVNATVNVGNNLVLNSGTLNFLSNVNNVYVNGNVIVAGDITSLTVPVSTSGNLNTSFTGTDPFWMQSITGTIDVAGSIISTENDAKHIVQLDASTINVGADIHTGNQGAVIIGDGNTNNLNVDGNLQSDTGGLIDLAVDTTTTGTLFGAGKFIARGDTITATTAIDNSLNIQNGITFNGTDVASGLVVLNTNNLGLITNGIGGDISVSNGINIGLGNSLTLTSADLLNVSGDVTVDGTLLVSPNNNGVTFSNNFTNTGTTTLNGPTVTILDLLTNSGTANLQADNNIILEDVNNTGNLNLNALSIVANNIVSNNGVINSISDTLSFNNFTANATGVANLYADIINATTSITSIGNFVQGSAAGVLNIRTDAAVNAGDINVTGNFNAVANTVTYTSNDFEVTGDINVSAPATVNILTNNISVTGDTTNAGALNIQSDTTSLGNVINNGSLSINSGAVNNLLVNNFTNSVTGSANLQGIGMIATGDLNVAGNIHQNEVGVIPAGDININSADYNITALDIYAGNIYQNSGVLTLNTDNFDITGNINAVDLKIAAQTSNFLNANVDGNVSGGVDFVGLRTMHIGGDYTFDDTSSIHAIVEPRATAGHNYWATVSLANDNTLGQITNGVSAEALIQVDGMFTSDISTSSLLDVNTPVALNDGKIGLTIYDTVDQGTAIWLLHADDGVQEDGLKTRNVIVKYCNANGSICYNYLDSLGNGSTNNTDTPIYLSVRDSDTDGDSDSLYIVFDPRFGGPVNVFNIAPIVEKQTGHTQSSVQTANAFDELISSALTQNGFNNTTPIEVIPIIFQNTNMQTIMTELYNRMEQYQLNPNGSYFENFSKLFNPMELDKFASMISNNEHTNSRDLQDYMFDEFIWNRNRSLNKTWFNADFGTFNDKTNDGDKTKGDRFSVSAGIDWQQSKTLILGFNARVSQSSISDGSDIDLTYKPNEPIAGRIDVDVSDTNIGFGMYFLKTISQELRLYGNVFGDMHMLNMTRDQNYIDTIEGKGNSLSVISEFGLMHDWLNQYIVGNAYVRGGYNFGLDLTETAAGSDYMNLKSDGYMILTPGYSLTFQKRIYTSSWFQMRPNISFGLEYDVLGSPDTMQFKFAQTKNYSDYTISNDPLWANAGAGIEFLSAAGWQVGLNYRYQYNADIKMNKVRLSGIYRF